VPVNQRLPSNLLLPGIREELIRQHLWLALYWTHLRRDEGLDLDDLESAAMWGLNKASMVWQHDRGVSFRFYATRWVKMYVFRAAVMQRRAGFSRLRGQQVTRIGPPKETEGRTAPEPYEVAYTESPWVKMDMEAMWAALMGRLDPRERKFVKMRFCQCFTLAEIGRRFRRTKQWSQLEERRIINKLRWVGREIITSVTGREVPLR
jgi:RNA polymerase sigma factor (sigma-70 family)